MAGPGFAVIDFETTGFSPKYHHRVVEVAVVQMSPVGTVTAQWETLIDPQRDVGATAVHGIHPADLIGAPRFADIVPQLVDLLDGRVVVAHNARFDLGFLRAELERAGYPGALGQASAFEIVDLDTMALASDLLPGSGRSLADCCAAFDIELDGAHRALVDAVATAQLLGAFIDSTGSGPFWDQHLERAFDAPWPALGAAIPRADARPALVRGDRAAARAGTFLSRIAVKLPDIPGPDEQRQYLAALDRALLDRYLSVHEADGLVELAASLGIGRDAAEQLHVLYFESVAAAAWADGVLTTDEMADLAQIGTLLSLPAEVVRGAFAAPALEPAVAVGGAGGAPEVIGTFSLSPGDEIVLTGEMRRPREEWMRALAALGFLPKPAVTKKIKAVIAADPDSLSGKARKARDYGIPILGEDWLEARFG